MIAIGTQFYPAAGDAGRRQARCRASLLALAGAIPVNLQFADETFELDGFLTRPVLRQDSRTITGAAGVRKPLISEMFDALAGVARDEGCRYFAYLNADIEVSQPALDTVRSGERDAYAFSRVDVDPATGADLGVQIFGLDLFAIDTAWWMRERRRFRPYIAGEACWDDVYASIVCAHGHGEIVNETPGIFHQCHAAVWNDGPFAEHNAYLATLDAPYFSRWCRYAMRLDESRKAGTAVDRRRLARETMGNPRLSARETVIHAARHLRARFRHARSISSRAAATPRQSPRTPGSAEP